MVPTDERDLADAADASAVQDWLISRLAERHPTTGIHCMVFGATAAKTAQSMVYLGDDDPAPFQGKIQPAVGALLQHHRLPDLFGQPNLRLRVEEHLGWRSWLRSPVYQEHFRPMRSARQLVLGMATPSGTPLGFVSIAQSEVSERLSAEEERHAAILRDSAGRALSALTILPSGSAGLSDIVDDVLTTLPFATFLIDEDGIALWMNREAEIRLGLVALAFGSSSFYGGAGVSALRELGAMVQRELREPGTSTRRGFSWMTCEEFVLIRRVERDVSPRLALVCIYAPPTSPIAKRPADALQQKFRLSARETEIALMAAEGYTVLNIARRLNIAESTVATLLKRAYKKMEVRSRAELSWKVGRL